MIGLNQFRYGNFFLKKKNNQILKFYGISPINQTLYFLDTKSKIVDYDNLEISGLPINEEILLRFGFVKYDQMGDNLFFIHTLFERIGLKISIWSDNKIDINIYNSNETKFEKCQEIKYIHQLQNFIFGISLNELILNEI